MNYELASDRACGGFFPESNTKIIISVMRELRSRSKKLNGKYNEITGAELPHNNAYFITLMESYSRGTNNNGPENYASERQL